MLRKKFFRPAIFFLVLIIGVIVAISWQRVSRSQAKPAPTRALIAQPPPPPPPTATPTSPPPLTNTPVGSDTPGPSPTASPYSTQTPEPTDTAVPTATPTSVPQHNPTIAVTGTGLLLNGVPTPITPIPSPVPTFEVPDEITNILLLGQDMEMETGDVRTDTMIIVSVNRETKTASMVSLPRDLYVYLPDRTMSRLNTAVKRGGVELLEQTILYNFGIPIHYYALVNFDGFKDIIDTMGGVNINVSCRLEDWRLKSPELDIYDEDNYEWFVLEPGVYNMDGDTALWYARSRLTSSDFYRGWRQQQLLRAILNQGVDLGMIADVPTLWNVYQDRVETDLDIGRILQLAAVAPAVKENGVEHLYLARATKNWTAPNGAFILLPVWEGPNGMEKTFTRLFEPSDMHKSGRRAIFVEVINATNNEDLAVLAADNLSWQGFVPVIGPAEYQAGAVTRIEYFGPNFKGSYNPLLTWVFNRGESVTQLVDDPDYPYAYRVILGEDYNPCRDALYAP